jgi:hypothetical protein
MLGLKFLVFSLLLVAVSCTPKKMILVIDAGSSGTKFSLYPMGSHGTCRSDPALNTLAADPKTDSSSYHYPINPSISGKAMSCSGSGGLVFSPKLVSCDANDMSKMMYYLTEIMKANSEPGVTTKWKVVAGATAGNRIVSDADDEDAWHRFRDAVRDNMNVGDASTLHGTEEAKLEWAAINEDVGKGTSSTCKGFISAGGSSAQMAFCLPSSGTNPTLDNAVNALLGTNFPGGCNIENQIDHFVKEETVYSQRVLLISFLAGNSADATSKCDKSTNWFYWGGAKEVASNFAAYLGKGPTDPLVKKANPKDAYTSLVGSHDANWMQTQLAAMANTDLLFAAVKTFATVYNAQGLNPQWYAGGSFANLFKSSDGAGSTKLLSAIGSYDSPFGMSRLLANVWMTQMGIPSLKKAASGDWTLAMAQNNFFFGTQCTLIYAPVTLYRMGKVGGTGEEKLRPINCAIELKKTASEFLAALENEIDELVSLL